MVYGHTIWSINEQEFVLGFGEWLICLLGERSECTKHAPHIMRLQGQSGAIMSILGLNNLCSIGTHRNRDMLLGVCICIPRTSASFLF